MIVKPLSILTAAATDQLADSEPRFVKKLNGFSFTAKLTDDSLWIIVNWPDAAEIALRTAYAPDILVINKVDEDGGEVIFHLSSSVGKFKVSVSFPQSTYTLLNYRVTFSAAQPLLVNYW